MKQTEHHILINTHTHKNHILINTHTHKLSKASNQTFGAGASGGISKSDSSLQNAQQPL